MSILNFLLGAKGKAKSSTKGEDGSLFLEIGTQTEHDDKTELDQAGTNTSYLYYQTKNHKKINVVPEFVESQSDSEIVITFDK